MTTTTSLKAWRREGRGKGAARKLRAAGRIPGIVYGKDMEPISIEFGAMEAEHLFQAISVENTIVSVEIEGDEEAHETLVREIQSHAHRYQLIHVDFLRIQTGVAVEVEIPVELVGTPIGVKMNGGMLEQIIHELRVECIPSLIPEMISVDVSALDLEDSLHVSDITLPEGVTVTSDEERTICIVSVPRAVAAEGDEGEEEAGGEAAEPEVIGGKDDDDEDEG